jgi:hypothetical protein
MIVPGMIGAFSTHGWGSLGNMGLLLLDSKYLTRLKFTCTKAPTGLLQNWIIEETCHNITFYQHLHTKQSIQNEKKVYIALYIQYMKVAVFMIGPEDGSQGKK